ncbi:hypothetical protein AJ79_03190 [Helicocarpus griseus UAMH5409]|uniref:Nucleoside phosphorylase domain-containing protein n=1 Tax=Helicocarpus griseus UAMH5409 TaxID=1447875 RepID=A0A2B7Y0G5_9EURO|nr:hypothetical protein AJ79_03190 [Helicocarpus griseus UAMH5409]
MTCIVQPTDLFKAPSSDIIKRQFLKTCIKYHETQSQQADASYWKCPQCSTTKRLPWCPKCNPVEKFLGSRSVSSEAAVNTETRNKESHSRLYFSAAASEPPRQVMAASQEPTGQNSPSARDQGSEAILVREGGNEALQGLERQRSPNRDTATKGLKRLGRMGLDDKEPNPVAAKRIQNPIPPAFSLEEKTAVEVPKGHPKDSRAGDSPPQEGNLVRTQQVEEFSESFDASRRMSSEEVASTMDPASNDPPSEIKKYISDLADDLLGKIRSEQSDNTTMREIFGILPRLLEGFALKIGHNAPSQMHRDVMFSFMRIESNEIEKYIKGSYLSQVEKNKEAYGSEISRSSSFDISTPRGPRAMSFNEKIDMWDMGPAGEYTTPDNIIQIWNRDLMVLETTIEDEQSRRSTYQGLMETSAYNWLITSLRREFLLVRGEIDTMDEIRNTILSCLPCPGKVSRTELVETYKLLFRMNWNPLKFLQEQQYEEKPGDAIERAITLTGSDTDAQGLTCVQYLNQTWPVTGQHLIQLIKGVVQSAVGSQHHRKLPDNTELQASIDNTVVLIEVLGNRVCVAEIGEQLAWLGAALTSAQYESGVVCCTPYIDHWHRQPDKSLTLDLKFKQRKASTGILSPNGQCWHNVFRNPTVVKGYPIRRRADAGTGLEMSLDIMADLAQAKRITQFKEKSLIKGFSTMLVPTKFEDGVINWHLLYHRDGSQISYLENSGPYVPGISVSAISNARRHILGWCSEVKYNAGAADAAYSVRPSRLRGPQEGCRFGEFSIVRGEVVKASQHAAGQRDKPGSIPRSLSSLKNLHSRFVVLWDEKDKRGWLVNGTSALLHLMRASLHIDSKDYFCHLFRYKDEYLQEAAEKHKGISAIDVLTNKRNMELVLYEEGDVPIRLKDRYEELFSLLEKILDYQRDVMTNEKWISHSWPRKCLEGWDFIDLAKTTRDLFYPRMTTLDSTGKSWVDFTRAFHIPILFGSGFGEVLEPRKPVSCPQWDTLPKGKYYLAAATCKKSEEHSDFAQILVPSGLENNLSLHNLTDLEGDGAVIFGHNASHPWFWKDVGEPEKGQPPPELNVTDFSDSGIGSSIESSSISESDRSPRPPSPRQLPAFPIFNYSVGIVCALPKELFAVRVLFDETHQIESLGVPQEDTNHYVVGRICNHNVVALCLPSGTYGTNAAATAVTHLRQTFSKLQFCLLVGIGGGVPLSKNDIRLGDVVISRPTRTHGGVIQYDSGKTCDGDQFGRTGSLQAPPWFLMTAISSLESDPERPAEPLREYLDRIGSRDLLYKSPGSAQDQLFEATYLHPEGQETCSQCDKSRTVARPERPSNEPRIHYGLIASGNQVMKNAKLRDFWGKEHGVLCFEMEAAGIMNILPSLVIRGISDYSYTHKKDIWQEYAAASAAAYAKLLLSVVRAVGDCSGT